MLIDPQLWSFSIHGVIIFVDATVGRNPVIGRKLGIKDILYIRTFVYNNSKNIPFISTTLCIFYGLSNFWRSVIFLT
jgi:hypothetical protein